ncbi:MULTISPECIES: DUF362 domain-containing protein [Haloferax]|uniref:DUF362 domain-containing protein n=2 Tax=Haloferax TaxID=2251 RepID=A0A6G1Z609_9EURY|nr:MULTISPECIES: DUF362 domain-containing protein [Haloferax]KAB1185335.1 DUF362 domain-containing protein [Haloferax sp. CBA1149]MRW81972.1 DUF362 domain-containing protein [Haloferax marinisediminis]
MEFDFPGRDRLESANDVDVSDLPRAYRVSRTRTQPTVQNVPEASRTALDDIPKLKNLEPGSTVGITAGSRGIHDLPTVLESIVAELQERDLEPFVFPAMGSHGGATPEGQREMLRELGITPERLGCEIRSSLAVEEVGTDSQGWSIYAAEDALEADAVLLVNRVKLHTDFQGDIESGLCKMAVVGLGKQRGANAMHNAALDRGFADVIPEWASVLVDETPIVGGVGIIENADERAAAIEGIPAADLLEEEPALLSRSAEFFPELPVDDLDLLVVDEMGKEVSGTGLDTNVIGRVWFHGQAERQKPSLTRVYVRSLTPPSHGNALGVGLADLIHRDLASEIDFGDTYVNIVTSGEPVRAKLPFVVPSDATAFVLSASMTGVASADELRIARIRNTMTPDELWVSEPVAEELADRDDIEVHEDQPWTFDAEGNLTMALDSAAHD